MHVGIRWNDRSSPAVAATAIVACWTFATVFAALVLNLLGFDGLASRMMSWAGLFGAGALVLGLLAVVASLVLESDRAWSRRSSTGQPLSARAESAARPIR